MKAPAAARIPLGLVAWLAFLWLLLNQVLTPGQLVLALVLAVALSRATAPLRPLRARIRNPHIIAALLVIVLVDVVRSNVAVARIVLGPARGREVRSGFLDVPLDLRDPHGLAGLAMILTATPGTVWVDLAPGSRRVRVHILDLENEDEWIRRIKNRYEQPLMRIFE